MCKFRNKHKSSKLKGVISTLLTATLCVSMLSYAPTKVNAGMTGIDFKVNLNNYDIADCTVEYVQPTSANPEDKAYFVLRDRYFFVNELQMTLGFRGEECTLEDGRPGFRLNEIFGVVVGVTRPETVGVEESDTLTVPGLVSVTSFGEDAVIADYFNLDDIAGLSGVTAITNAEGIVCMADVGITMDLPIMPVRVFDFNPEFKSSIYTAGTKGRITDYKSIYLPSTVDTVTVGEGFGSRNTIGEVVADADFGLCSFESVEVSDDNMILESIDGVLINEVTDTLLLYPYKKACMNAVDAGTALTAVPGNVDKTLVINEASIIGSNALPLLSNPLMTPSDDTGVTASTEYPAHYNLVFDTNVKQFNSDALTDLKYLGFDGCIGITSRTFGCNGFARDCCEGVITHRNSDFHSYYERQNTENPFGFELHFFGESSAYSDVNIIGASKYGDVNVDGVVTVADIVGINMYTLDNTAHKLSVQGLANADTVRDNEINTNDAALILNYTTMLIEFEELGKVPTN